MATFKRQFLSLLTLCCAMTFIPLSAAHAATDNDVALTISGLASNEEVVEGTDFELTFTITNVGVNPINPVGAVAIYHSVDMTFEGLSVGYENSACIVPEPEDVVNIDMSSVSLLFCSYDTEAFDGYLPAIPAGGTYALTVMMTSASDFENLDTFLYAILIPGNPEDERWPLKHAIEAVTDVHQIPDIDSNNIDTYSYSFTPSTPTTVPSPTETTLPSNETDGSTQVQTETVTQSQLGTGQGATLDVLSSDDINNIQGSSLIEETKTDNDSSKKAEVALDLRSSLPDRISRDDTSTWEAIFTERYKSQFIGLGMIIAFSLGTYFIMRKRYLKKVSTEKEYRKALRAKNIYSTPQLEEKV